MGNGEVQRASPSEPSLNLELWHFAPGSYALEVSQDLRNFVAYEVFSVPTMQSPMTLPWLIGSEPPGAAAALFYRVVLAP